MTDQEIERLASERYPMNFDAYWAYDRSAIERSSFIEGAKAMRERFKQQIDKEPIAFFRTNILHHLNNEQMMSLRDWLNTYDDKLNGHTFKQDIIEAYCEGFTSTESAEQYYERKYNDTDSNSHT